MRFQFWITSQSTPIRPGAIDDKPIIVRTRIAGSNTSNNLGSGSPWESAKTRIFQIGPP